MRQQQAFATMVKILLLLPLLFSSHVMGAPDPSGEPVVVIQKMKFIPQEITIKRGKSIRWINREKRQYHSVWFEKYGDPEPDYLFPDEVFTRNFDSVGDFDYRCGPHPEMIGVVHVVE